MTYAPNQAFLGYLHPDTLAALPQPWFAHPTDGGRWGPHGEIMPEEEFYGLLKICDVFELVRLEAGFVEEIRPAMQAHPLLTADDLKRLGRRRLRRRHRHHAAWRRAGAAAYTCAMAAASAACKRRTTKMRLWQPTYCWKISPVKPVLSWPCAPCCARNTIDPATIPYVLNSGEEAVGDRYQRGGGNLAKAIAEMSHC